MALAFIQNGSVTQYPVGFFDLRLKYPDTSFPEDIENLDLSDFGAANVENVPQPSFDYRFEKIEEATPELTDGVWKQKWNVISLSPEEVQQIQDNQASIVRSQRNKLLANCDWTQLSDAPLTTEAKAAWADYREQLRMVPEQPGFPWDVQWPTEPTPN